MTPSITSFMKGFFLARHTVKKWAHHWKAHKILNKKLLSKISLLVWSSKWVEFSLFSIKLIKKKIILMLPINLNFIWKHFLFQNFMSFPMVCSFFQSHFPFKSYLQKFPLKNDQIMWYRVLYVEEKILCDINIFLRVNK